MSDCWTPFAVFLGVTFALALYRALVPLRCPRCRQRGFTAAALCHYSCKDIWGCRGGWYTVHHCPHCGLYRVHHRRGWEDLPPERWRETVEVKVFGVRLFD